MPIMPAKLVKGKIFEKIDDWVNDPAATPAARAIIALNQLPNHPLLHVLTHLVPPINLTRVEEKHLRDDWFDQVNGWWPALQPIEPIMKRGLIEALELVQLGGIGNTGRPLDTYWMCAGSEFEVYVTEGSTTLAKSRQITMIVSTPPPPTGPVTNARRSR